MVARFLLSLIALGCVNNTVFAQPNTLDTSRLAGYSYLIYGQTPSANTVQATGFWVSKNHHDYLVTACHVINGWVFESFKKNGSYPDTLFVKVGLKNTERDTALPIDIRKMKQTIANTDQPDIYFIPVSIPPNCKVNKLDSLILNYVPIPRTPQMILVYGFVAEDHQLLSKQFKGLTASKAIAYMSSWDDYVCSPIIYQIGYSGNALGPGNSGSPVYFISENSKSGHHSVKLQFGGLLFAGNQAKHRATVIRAEVVKALLDEL